MAGRASCVAETALPATRMPSSPFGADTVRDLDLKVRRDQSDVDPIRSAYPFYVMVAEMNINNVWPTPVRADLEAHHGITTICRLSLVAT